MQLLILISAVRDGESFTAVFHDASTLTSLSLSPKQQTHLGGGGGGPRSRLFASSADNNDENTANNNDVNFDDDSLLTILSDSSPPASVATTSKIMTSDLKALLPKQKMRFMKVSYYFFLKQRNKNSVPKMRW